MHNLSPVTDNCPTWISGRERMAIEMISWPISTKECYDRLEDRTLNTRWTCIGPSPASIWRIEENYPLIIYFVPIVCAVWYKVAINIKFLQVLFLFMCGLMLLFKQTALCFKIPGFNFLNKLSFWSHIKWASSWENLFLPYANNKGADQPAHPRSLISTFVVSYLDSIIPIFAIAWISRL